MTKYVGVDPGGTTGVAEWVDGKVSVAQLHSTGTFSGELVVCHELARRCRGADGVFVEGFVLRPFGGGSGGGGTTKSEGLSPVRITMGLRVMLSLVGWKGRYLELLPSDTKGVFSDARLREMDLWFKGMEHGRDAVRVLLLGMRKAGISAV